MSRSKSKTHRPNGPYLPVGDIGGEYCVKCRTSWPCQAVSEEQLCGNCGESIRQTEHGNWVHEILGVTYCHTQFPETLYNNWDNRVARPKESV